MVVRRRVPLVQRRCRKQKVGWVEGSGSLRKREKVSGSGGITGRQSSVKKERRKRGGEEEKRDGV